MKRLSLIALVSCFTFVTAAFGFLKQASAIPPFKVGFFELYVEADSANAELAKAAKSKTGKCWICHVNMSKRGEKSVKGLGKRVRNNYGKALAQFLQKKDFSSERRDEEPEKVKAEIAAGIKKVAALKSDPGNASSPTFAELMASGKLPGTNEPNLDDLKAAIEWRKKKDAEK